MEPIDNLYEEKDFLFRELRFTSPYAADFHMLVDRYNAVCDEIYRYEQEHEYGKS